MQIGLRAVFVLFAMHFVTIALLQGALQTPLLPGKPAVDGGVEAQHVGPVAGQLGLLQLGG